jgi:deoxycytidine triphosphate deaminase
MPLLNGDAASTHVDRLIHLDTQRADPGLDLTVGAVFRVTGAGQLDFGGSEFAPADREKLSPQRANPDDDYGWWKLERGTYVIRYNEALSLGEGQRAQVFPHQRLLQAGATHAAFIVDGAQDPVEVLLTVGDAGCHIKENSRVSRLLITETE